MICSKGAKESVFHDLTYTTSETPGEKTKEVCKSDYFLLPLLFCYIVKLIQPIVNFFFWLRWFAGYMFLTQLK